MDKNANVNRPVPADSEQTSMNRVIRIAGKEFDLQEQQGLNRAAPRVREVSYLLFGLLFSAWPIVALSQAHFSLIASYLMIVGMVLSGWGLYRAYLLTRIGFVATGFIVVSMFAFSVLTLFYGVLLMTLVRSLVWSDCE